MLSFMAGLVVGVLLYKYKDYLIAQYERLKG